SNPRTRKAEKKNKPKRQEYTADLAAYLGANGRTSMFRAIYSGMSGRDYILLFHSFQMFQIVGKAMPNGYKAFSTAIYVPSTIHLHRMELGAKRKSLPNLSRGRLDVFTTYWMNRAFF
ncbi:hypothetical protein ACJX0J_033968, partial [Zea mays]